MFDCVLHKLLENILLSFNNSESFENLLWNNVPEIKTRDKVHSVASVSLVPLQKVFKTKYFLTLPAWCISESCLKAKA